MILAKEQINRYLRQIILPEISGPGQKKLLESSVQLYSNAVADIAPLLYYLAATGIGSIYCQVKDPRGFDALSAQIRDLNDAVILELTECPHVALRVFLGKPGFFLEQSTQILTDFKPTVLAIKHLWNAGLGVFNTPDKVNQFTTNLFTEYPAISGDFSPISSMGEILSTCILGPLITLEVVKHVLGIGETNSDFKYFNLLTMEFNHTIPKLMLKNLFSQPNNVTEIDLTSKKVLIIGTGGLGSPAAYALTLAGIGTLGLVDYDTVEISNLNRQILHSTSRIGMTKVKSASLALKSLNPKLTILEYPVSLTQENVNELIADFDLVIDAVDNFPTRFLLNDACFLSKKPLIEAGVIRFDGSCTTLIPQQTVCYRCILPKLPPPGSIPTCAESGVLGPIPGIFGFIQATEAIKLLGSLECSLSNKMLFLDGLSSEFLSIDLHKKENCPLCGASPNIDPEDGITP